jgi:hypothetical protein
MRKILYAFCSGLLVAIPAGSSASPVSWGKVNVSYEQYRADSTECGMAGLTAELAQKKTPLMSNGINDTLDDFLMHNQIAAMQTRKQQADAGYVAIASCLTDLGYKPFRLTDDQATQLDTLTAGTEARHRYLYGLGVNADILSRQGIAPTETSRR